MMTYVLIFLTIIAVAGLIYALWDRTRLQKR